MYKILKETCDFKIIPGNFKSSGSLEILSIDKDIIEAKVELLDQNEMADYVVNSNVEVFGVNNLGLIYFETKILSVENFVIKLEMTQDYSIIQRREYSRVGLSQGTVVFKDMAPEIVRKVEDISAGGVKLITNIPLELDKYYEIEIKLSNNMRIECAMSPIRIKEVEYNGNKAYSISGKFVDLENTDRIVLVQYAFKIKMEEQNIENK